MMMYIIRCVYIYNIRVCVMGYSSIYSIMMYIIGCVYIYTVHILNNQQYDIRDQSENGLWPAKLKKMRLT